MMERKKVKNKSRKKISRLVENDGNLDEKVEENEEEQHKDGKRRKRVKGRVVVGGASVRDEEEKNSKSLKRKKRKNKERRNALIDDAEEEHTNIESCSKGSVGLSEAGGGVDTHSPGKYKKHGRKKKKGRDSLGNTSIEKSRECEHDEVYNISSVDEDCSRGMKKWITEYYQSRPGLKVLQQRIDEFIVAHEAQLEQERKEREAQAAQGGWTVVVHHKGRKKTTDTESGITVGSVAQAAVEDKMAKKKNKEVGLDFYRFQKREAKRNEIMALQSKFEEDKKRIQQLRAARKFRPY